MATAAQELEQFRQFVIGRLGEGNADATLDELFDLWRHEFPSDELHVENVAAIAASIDDFKRGERGTVAGDHSSVLRREFGLSGS